ncbi:linear gramicidin dehydrogenase LgrE [Streptomyces avermitilis]|nr:thioesterase domain-containing protein [Streptomyces avermitilis]BBJ50050.1 thioesterase [Streptomyces avermitilis]GDY62072.1 thioesterase [Streptomyces avermitilis]GDY77824.1 thioesterase [Streptomyces avermitilis]GDY86703.1 thioesterase [Streptomyces avermitilis]
MTSAIGQEMSREGQWFHPAEPSLDASVRLFLLPHAGSGAIIYRDWENLLPSDIAPQAVTLPGRHNRRGEATFEDWDPLLDALHEAVLDDLDDRPFAFFGHCLGAQLAFRLAIRMEEDGGPAPVMLGMSGWSPQGFFLPTEEQSRMPAAEMVEWIKKLGSFPAEIYDNPEMLALVVPALRADLRVAAQYVDDKAGVSCPLASYGGRSDPLQEHPDAMTHWAGRSPDYLGHSEYPGGHFYIDAHAQSVTAHFAQRLQRVVSALVS